MRNSPDGTLLIFKVVQLSYANSTGSPMLTHDPPPVSSHTWKRGPGASLANSTIGYPDTALEASTATPQKPAMRLFVVAQSPGT